MKWKRRLLAAVFLCLAAGAGLCAWGWSREYRRLEIARNGMADDVITVFSEFYVSDYEGFCRIAQEGRLAECYRIHGIQEHRLHTFLEVDEEANTPELIAADQIMGWYGLLLRALDETGPTQELEEDFARAAPHFSLLFDWDDSPQKLSPATALSQRLRVLVQKLQVAR